MTTPVCGIGHVGLQGSVSRNVGSMQVEGVGAAAVILDGVGIETFGEDEDIVPLPADERVGAGTAGERVGPSPAVEDVVGAVAGEDVVELRSDEILDAAQLVALRVATLLRTQLVEIDRHAALRGPVGDGIDPVAALDGVGARTTGNPVVAGAGIDEVLALAGAQDVVAVPGEDDVVSFPSADHIGFDRAGHRPAARPDLDDDAGDVGERDGEDPFGRHAPLIGCPHRDGVAGRRLEVEERAVRHAHHAGERVDGEPAAGIVDQRIGDRAGSRPEIEGKRRHPDHRAVGRVFLDAVAGGVGVAGRTGRRRRQDGVAGERRGLCRGEGRITAGADQQEAVAAGIDALDIGELVGAFAAGIHHPLAAGKADGRRGQRSGIGDRVGAGAAVKRVVAGAAVERVVAAGADEAVVAGVAGQRDAARPAGEGVDVARADEHQVLDAADGMDRVGEAEADRRPYRVDAAAAGLVDDVAGIVDDINIGASATDQHVGAAGAVEQVVAAAATEHIGAAIAGERVVAAAASDVLDVVDQGKARGIAGVQVDGDRCGGTGVAQRIARPRIVFAVDFERLDAGRRQADDRRDLTEPVHQHVECVVAGYALYGKRVASRAAVDSVGAVTDRVGDIVVAVAALDDIGAAETLQLVVALAADQRIGAAVSGERIVARTASGVLDAADRVETRDDTEVKIDLNVLGRPRIVERVDTALGEAKGGMLDIGDVVGHRQSAGIARQLDDRAARNVDLDGIGAGRADDLERVATRGVGAAVNAGVGAVTGNVDDGVVAAVAAQRVGAGTAGQPVVAAVTGERVVARTADDVLDAADRVRSPWSIRQGSDRPRHSASCRNSRGHRCRPDSNRV